MKALKAIIAAGALLCIPAIAQAAPVTGQISIAGSADAINGGTYDVSFGSATGVDFVTFGTTTNTPGVAGAITQYSGGTGNLAFADCLSSTCGTIKDIASFATTPPISSFITFAAVPGFSFDLTSITNVITGGSGSTGTLSFTGNGIIHLSGYDDTFGALVFSGQGTGVTTYSGTVLISAVPEPASIALLGGGLLGLAGFAGMRRRKSKVA